MMIMHNVSDVCNSTLLLGDQQNMDVRYFMRDHQTQCWKKDGLTDGCVQWNCNFNLLFKFFSSHVT